MTPENLAQLQIELRTDEAVRYTVYFDTNGIPTTGVGHNLCAKPLPNGWKYPLNDVQVTTLLLNDVQEDAITPLNTHLPWWLEMDDVRQRVIANMCFNMGINKLLAFHNTLASMQGKDYAAAEAGMKASAWYGQVGARAVRLCHMMLTGKVLV